MFFLESEAYLRQILRQQDAPGLPLVEPFGPILLGSKAQVSRAVMFMPYEGKAPHRFIEPGVHQMRFYARFRDGRVTEVAQRKVVFEKGVVENWRKGTTIAGAQFESDRPAEDVLKEFGVNVRRP